MRALYQAHKANRLDKADALRHAQLALLRGPATTSDASDAQRGLTRVAAATGAVFDSLEPRPGAKAAEVLTNGGVRRIRARIGQSVVTLRVIRLLIFVGFAGKCRLYRRIQKIPGEFA
jgi:hypothetical protein